MEVHLQSLITLAVEGVTGQLHVPAFSFPDQDQEIPWAPQPVWEPPSRESNHFATDVQPVI
jgi:hypothetical protein